MPSYTVIGIYADNQQPWIQHVQATTPTHAALKGIKDLSNSDDKPDVNNIYVVEVIEGTHQGTLCNDSPLDISTLQRMLEGQ
jgi:hypothetical protein